MSLQKALFLSVIVGLSLSQLLEINNDLIVFISYYNALVRSYNELIVCVLFINIQFYAVLILILYNVFITIINRE